MAKAKTQNLKGKSKMVSFIEWLDRIGTGALLAEFFSRVFKRGGDAVEKKIEKAFGLEVKKGGEGYDDEILFDFVVDDLSIIEKKKEIRAFQKYLRRVNPKSEEALILAVASRVQKRNKKDSNKADPKNPTEVSYIEYDTHRAVSYVEELLAEKTNEERLEFLAPAFRNFAPEKKPSPAKKAWDKGREKAKTGWEKFQENQQRDLKESKKRDLEIDQESGGWGDRLLARAKARREQQRKK